MKKENKNIVFTDSDIKRIMTVDMSDYSIDELFALKKLYEKEAITLKEELESNSKIHSIEWINKGIKLCEYQQKFLQTIIDKI